MTTPPLTAGSAMSGPYREDIGDLKKLPAELRAQIADKTGPTKKQQLVLDVLAGRGGRASLSEIIVDLWRKTGNVSTRSSAGVLCGTLVRKKLVRKIEGEIVTYATTDPAAPAAAPKKPAAKPAAREAALPKLDDANRERAKKAYDLRSAGKLSFNEIAVQIGIGFTPDQCSSLAQMWAEENNLKWPV